MKLNMRRRYKRRLPARVKEPLLQPIGPNITWSMDFMHDGLNNGQTFRSFNVIDDFNREVLNITISKGLSSKRVTRELDKLIEWRGIPECIRVDNGPEFIARNMHRWCEQHQIELKFIQKGKPTQNGYVERFNRTYRTEVLDRYAFDDLQQARLYTQAWMWVYNNERPHSSFGYLTPNELLLKYGKPTGRSANVRMLQDGFPTFQQDIHNNTWKSLILNAPKTG